MCGRRVILVGMVVTTSPSLSLYRMVVLPAASSPTIKMRMSRLETSRAQTLAKILPWPGRQRTRLWVEEWERRRTPVPGGAHHFCLALRGQSR